MIIITTSRPGESPSTHRFEGEKVRIGREADNDLVLDSATCSRYHAEIIFDGDIPKIVDLGSTNGIAIGDKRVPDYLLSEGQKLTLGEFELSISLPSRQSAKTVAIPIGGVAAADPTPSKVIYLHVLERDRVRGVKIVAGADYVMGRSPGSDIVLDDSSCSGRHAIILWRDERAMIRDLESANGTRLNDEPVLESEIRPGDQIRVGRTEITVSDRPVDTADEDVLLKRTRLGMPVPAPAQPEAPHTPDAPPVPRWVIPAAIVVILAIIAGAVLWRTFAGGSPRAEDTTAKPAVIEELVVQVQPVLHKELSFSFTSTGTLKPQRQVTVSSEIPGRVVSVPGARGLAVQAGAELVRLDDRQIRLQITEAASSITTEQVDLARQDFERKQRLFADGAVTRSVLDQSKNHWLGLDSAYRSAQARIAQLRQQASKTRIASPLTGVVARLEVEPGEFVSPGMPVAVIEDMEEVLVVVEVADRDVVRLRPLQIVEATSDAFPNLIFSGVVERVGSAANPVTRAFEVEARIANPEGRLRSGMIISLRILLEKRTALVVPAEALLDEDGETARVVVVANGIARRMTVTVGRRSDRDVELLSGLAEGDEVVVAGHDRIRDGQSVKSYRAD